MRKLLVIFAIITGVCIAFSDELRNKTALTIKSSEPFSSSILMRDIDSITYSNIAIDGSRHDSMVTKRIHISDSIIEYSLDSIQKVTFDDVSDFMRMNTLYVDLASFLDEMPSNNHIVENLLSDIKIWLSNRDDIVSYHLMDYDGIEVEHLGGLKSIISINDVSSLSESYPEAYTLNKVSSRGETRENVEIIKYHNITSQPSDTILYKSDILYFQGRNSYDFGNSEPEKLIREIERSPLKMNLIKNEECGDLGFLVRNIKQVDLAIISYTHGIGDGGFQLSNSYTFNIDENLISPVFNIEIENGSIFYDIDNFYRIVACVRPEFFLKYATGQGIGFLNYCWSYFLQEYLQNHFEIENKVFTGYDRKSYRDENIQRSKNYLANILHGCTHSESVSKVNEMTYPDGVKLVDKNRCNKRFLGIENLGTIIRPDNDDCRAQYVIRGWKNLKKDIDRIRIYYKGERFERPDATCQYVEYDMTRKSIIDDDKGVYSVIMAPCSSDAPYYLNWGEGPDYYVGIFLNGLETDSLYYSLAFEYNYENTKNIYYSDVESVGGITYGVTPGQCIDMGLPSGTKWAAWNMGASKPEDEGGTYGWGEPTGTYTEAPVYLFAFEKEINTYPEVVPHYGGENPANNISGSRYDIAHAKWGNGWRLPTVEQWNELMDENYTTWQRYTLYGVQGVRITSKINRNKIFIPLQSAYIGEKTYFWTANLDPTSTSKYDAKTALVSCYKKDVSKSAGEVQRRWTKLHVRPVKK